MKMDALKKMYGAEYPDAVLVNGVRMSIWLESQFTRFYWAENRKDTGTQISRFMDGSASMSAEQLQREWPTWTECQREDFCQASVWLYKQPDYADMLRFIMQHGGPKENSAIAGSIATTLPCEEAYVFLLGALRAAKIGKSSNVVLGIAATKHPNAEATLRQQLQILWNDPTLWNNDSFLNWVAHDAEKCIQCLIELGASPADFDEKIRQLSQHVCQGNCDSVRRWLSKHYSWLSGPRTINES
jgi:hypothetical protein